MKIAQIAPLMESVPPRLYGGTERIVHHLTEELVRQGHDVTLFASGDSVTSAKLVPCVEQAIRLNPAVRDAIPHYLIMLDRLRSMAHRFDILHFHIDAFQMPLFRDLAGKTVTTLHGRQDILDMHCLYKEIPEMPLVSISNAQRAPIAEANVIKTIYHGLPLDLYAPTYDPRGGYLAFIGRISPEKTARPRHRDRVRIGSAAEDRRKSQRHGRGVFSRSDRASAGSAGDRVPGRDRRPRKGQIPGRGARCCCSRSTGPSRSASS